jgi:NAD(P)-dependent dehydrogenase (short-subunit alcohol dehydrogenase family)
MLDEQATLVVGAAGGIGRAVVRRYLAEGALVVAVDRDAARLDELHAQFDDGRLVVMAGDASTWDMSEAVVAKAVQEFGGLDVLVSCVGVWDQAVRLVDIPGERLADAFDECLRINLGSIILNIRAAAEQLALSRGRVVVTGSFASYRTSAGGVLYTAAKHAVVGLVAQLAYELAPRIRVNGVAPGVTDTVMSGLQTLGQQPRDALLPGTEQALPLQALPDAEDFGGIYALLGSAKETAAITGTVVTADSGLLIRGLPQAHPGSDL